MSSRMTPTGTAKKLERRRHRAVALLEAGHSGNEVARMLGVTRSAVSLWKTTYQREGPKALDARRPPGTKPKLTAKQRKQLAAILLKGARKSGYPTERWTLPRVTEVIRQRFGVVYNPTSVWHVLRGMGWTGLKRGRPPREADEKAIARSRANAST